MVHDPNEPVDLEQLKQRIQRLQRYARWAIGSLRRHGIDDEAQALDTFKPGDLGVPGPGELIDARDPIFGGDGLTYDRVVRGLHADAKRSRRG